jgi:LPS-assembly protein
VLDQQLQLAAKQMHAHRRALYHADNVVASSCRVCAANPTPLWEIRARRVVHDQQERQIYFDHAQFRLSGVPVFYIPRLRMPDPTLDRATGFLMPSFRTTSDLGTGAEDALFHRHRRQPRPDDAPYLSTKNGRAVELRYRQAFATGEIEMTGALARDDMTCPATTRLSVRHRRLHPAREFPADLRRAGPSRTRPICWTTAC